MPPLPVTGLCCFPRCAYDREHVIADATRVELASTRRDLLERGRVDVEHLDVAEDLVLQRARACCRAARPLRHRACRLENAMRCRADGSAALPSRCIVCCTATPPRSKGMPRTIVVRVRAIPGVAFSRASRSSRCWVERVTTLQTKLSSPATECTSQTSGMLTERARELDRTRSPVWCNN